MIQDSKAYIYAKWCVEENERKVPRYVKKQCSAWIKIADGMDEQAVICEGTYEKICKILKLMVHPDLHCSMYDGLEDYAWLFIVAVFCTKMRSDLKIRFYITALLEICRKNFKTFNSAVVFIIGMLTEPKFGRFFSVAPDLKLSKELQIAIKKIIRSSPLLSDELEPVFKTLRSEIRCLLTESDYTPLAYSEDKMDGKMANIFLADEAGAMDSYPVEAMRSSQITLFNKLGIIISTQYPNDNNVMIDEVDISKKVLDELMDEFGDEDVTRRFSLLYEPDEDLLVNDQWKTNDLVIYQSNPVAVAHEYIFKAIKSIRTMAILYENKRENYLCKHNNIKYKGLGVEGYIDITKVRECKVTEDLEFWKCKRVWIGLDLSLTEDNTAVSMVTEYQGVIYSKTWGFIPGDKKDIKSKTEKVDYDKLIRRGVCFESSGEVISYEDVENHILSLEEKYGVEIMQIGYDRMNAISTVQKLESAGYECVEIKQHSSVLHMPTKLIKEYILSKLFRYDENLMLEINFQNARCTEDTNLNKYVNKKKSAGKVDMVVSLINAVYLLQQELLYGQDDFIIQTG